MERGGSKYVFLAWLLAAPALGPLAGCGQSTTNEVAANQDDEGKDKEGEAAEPSSVSEPAAVEVVQEFLEAIKTGDETKSNDLLTPLARQKTAEMDMAVAPMG